MNIFQRIKEVKLPFLAVIAALVFGGIVTPANAAPNLTAVSVTSPTSSSATISMSVNVSSICKYVVRLFGAATPSSSDVDMASVDQTNKAVGTTSPSTTPTGTISGLSSAQSYVAYAYCYDSPGQNSQVVASSTFLTTSAQAPIISSPSSSTPATGQTQLTYSVSGAGYCNVVVRLASDPVPTVNYVIAATSVVSPDVFVSSRPANSSTITFTLTGLTTSTAYKAYFACADNGNASLSASVITHSFTQQAASGGGGYSACQTVANLTAVRSSTSTLTSSGTYVIYPGAGAEIDCSVAVSGGGSRVEIDGQLVRPAAFPIMSYVFLSTPRTLASIQANNLNNVPIVDGSVYTIKYYSGLSAAPTANDVPIRTVSITLYPNGTPGNQQAPTTAAVQRPLPQISFVAPSTPGFSARPTSDTRKGTLTLQGENFSDLTAITIGGKAATFTVKDGKLEIKLPAGVTGFPEMVMTNGGGSITMQNAIEIVENKVQKLTRFVGDRFTKAGLEQLENACIQNKEANSIEAVVVVAADATEADYANAVKAATDAAAYLDKVSKRISHTSVTVAKTGEAGSKPTVEMNFTKN